MSRVLIVFEEDNYLGKVIEDSIKKEGWETLFIDNASVAIDQLGLFKPQIMVLEMDLKTTDPFKILEEKKKDKKFRSIATIVVSSTGDVDEVKKVLELGVNDYIVKSQFKASELLSKLRNNVSDDKEKVEKPADSLEGRKIMWVEDDQFLSDLIARKLSQHHCKLLFTSTGEEALELLTKERPDVILLDLFLPGIGGLEVLENVKKDKNLKDIPVIILSNFTQNNEMEKARSLGATRFLTKATVVLDDIVKEVKEVLKEK
jgi:DNA-binding response OmpR family regulator